MAEETAGSGKQQGETGFTGGGALRVQEPRAWKPFAVAGAVVLLLLIGLLFFGRQRHAASQPGGAGIAPAAAYASSLPLTQVQMSDSSSLSGSKETYLDGIVTNHGDKVVTAVTVQVGFKSYTGLLSQKSTLPLNLVRSREPYVDTEPVSVEPLKPGDSHAFRLIFDSVPQDWNGAYPVVRIIAVTTR